MCGEREDFSFYSDLIFSYLAFTFSSQGSPFSPTYLFIWPLTVIKRETVLSHSITNNCPFSWAKLKFSIHKYFLLVSPFPKLGQSVSNLLKIKLYELKFTLHYMQPCHLIDFKLFSKPGTTLTFFNRRRNSDHHRMKKNLVHNAVRCSFYTWSEWIHSECFHMFAWSLLFKNLVEIYHTGD